MPEYLTPTQEELFHSNLPFAKWLAGQKREINYDDALSFAMEALLTGIHTYDPSKGTLTTWVRAIFNNAIKNYIKQKLKEEWIPEEKKVPLYEEIPSEENGILWEEVIEDLKTIKSDDETLYKNLKNKLQKVLDEKAYKMLEAREEGMNWNEVAQRAGYASGGVAIQRWKDILPEIENVLFRGK